MPYVKVSTSRTAIACLRYGEHEKGCERSGVDCPTDPDVAARLFRADRIMWNKDKGLEAHVIIQSFDGCEVSPADANRLGVELARRVAPGYRAVVFTHEQNEHTKRGNVHNHIVIEAVRAKDGRRLRTQYMLQKSRAASDALAKEAGLSIIKENDRHVDMRYTRAEQAIVERGGDSWKDRMRTDIEEAYLSSKNEDEFRQAMARRGYEISERFVRGEKTWTYKNRDGRRCRAKKLGDDYTRSNVCKTWDKEKERQKQLAAERAKAAALEKQRAPERSPKEIAQTQTVERSRGFDMGWGR